MATTPTAVLDAASFPHLIDTIFENADAVSLMALRANKAWRSRAEASLAFHISIRETEDIRTFPVTSTYELQSVGKGVIGSVESSSILTFPLDIVPSFLRSTAVIDLRVPAFKLELKRVLQHRASDVVYRFHKHCTAFSIDTVQPRCVVLFAEDIAKQADSTVRYFTDYGLRVLRKCRLVLHLRRPGRSALSSAHRTDFTGIEALVLVIHPWPARFDPNQRHAITTFSERNLGHLVDLLTMAGDCQVPTTVIGFDFSKPHAECPDPNKLRQFVKEWSIRDLLDGVGLLAGVSYNEFLQAPGNVAYYSGHHPQGLRFLSLDEYRNEVGEVQFDIEMNPGLVACPRPKQAL